MLYFPHISQKYVFLMLINASYSIFLNAFAFTTNYDAFPFKYQWFHCYIIIFSRIKIDNETRIKLNNIIYSFERKARTARYLLVDLLILLNQFHWDLLYVTGLEETQSESIWKKKIGMMISNKGETNVKVVWCSHQLI